jgi:hypothetical protein
MLFSVQPLWPPCLRGEIAPKTTHHRGTEDTEDPDFNPTIRFPYRNDDT